MNQAHTRFVTFDRPDGRLPGPHALAWLYATPSDDPGQIRAYTIDVASRMFPWSDDERPAYNVKDAPVLVRQMVSIAERELKAGHFDPLDRTDRRTALPDGAFFIGVALSSLGVPGMDWTAVKPSAFGFGIELPASCSVRLVDGTWLELTKSGRSEWKVECNRAMGHIQAFDWSWRPTMPPNYVPRAGSAQAYLDQLMALTDQAYELRKQQQQQQHSRQRTRR